WMASCRSPRVATTPGGIVSQPDQRDVTMTPPSSHGAPNDRRRRTGQHPIQTRYRQLYDELLEILVQLDPLGAHSTDWSAPAPEVASILARLREARVADDVE